MIKLCASGMPRADSPAAQRCASVGRSQMPSLVRTAVASKDGNASIWQVDGWKPVGALLHHAGPVVTASFSPDGSELVTTSADGAHLWRAARGTPFGIVLVHRGPVNAATFSPDGKSVITASEDGTARLWSIPDVQPDQIGILADLAEAVGRLRIDDQGSLPSLRNRDEIMVSLRARTRAGSGGATSDLDGILRGLF